MRLVAAIVIVTVILTVVLTIGKPASAGVTNPNPIVTTRIDITNDTYIVKSTPTTNFCTSQSLSASASGPSVDASRTLLQFSLASIPSNAVIVSAYLELTSWSTQSTTGGVGGVGGVSEFVMNRTTSAWTCSTVTWNTQPGQGVLVQDFFITNTTYTLPQPIGYDIILPVRNWFNGTWPNYGLLIHVGFDLTVCCFQKDFWRSFESTFGGQPFVLIQYQLPLATIYPAYYCSGGPCETSVISGSGLPPYLFSVFYSENNGTLRRAIRPDIIPTNLSTYFRLQVKDFLGNVLYDANQTVNSWQYPWLVAIPYGILQAYNMRDGITTFSIKPAGGLAMNIDLVPRAWWAIPLKSGIKYWLNFTLLDSSFNILGTVNVVQVMGTKLSYIVNGTSLTQISANVNNNWFRSNETFAVTAGTGNILLAPHGLNVFEAYYTVNFGIASLPITLWLFGVIAAILGWSAWAFAYRGKLSRRIRSWPRRAKLFAGFALLPLSSTLLIAFIVHLAGGSVFIPIPWAPIT